MYIYIDILIITNLYTDFLLLKGTSLITHSRMKTSRGLFAALIGSIASLMILLPKMNTSVLMLSKAVISFIVVYAAFGGGKEGTLWDKIRLCTKRVFIFWLISFIFAGVCMGISYFSDSDFLISRNGVVYADFSLSALIVSTAAAYILVNIYKFFADPAEHSGGMYTVIVSDSGKTVSFKAAADTGNVLCDSFTGRNVIVVPHKSISELYGRLPEYDKLYTPNTEIPDRRWRFIPYSTASGTGLLPMIRPESICIKNDESGKFYLPDVYLGITENDMEFAVFHPKILL
ncbi:MAG: sigma-E processing peptidase SpoIIGA [Oscillospiraceae bacterium]